MVERRVPESPLASSLCDFVANLNCRFKNQAKFTWLPSGFPGLVSIELATGGRITSEKQKPGVEPPGFAALLSCVL
jgi:hypothetical protein